MSQPAEKKPGQSFIDSLQDSLDLGLNESNLEDTFETLRYSGKNAVEFPAPLEPGDLGKLGPYRIIRELGRGAMGLVYLAFDTRLNRKLALKVMRPQFAVDHSSKERFLHEAKAAAQITHDNVVIVYEADERDGIPFIAMQFLQGCPLDAHIMANGLPSIPEILRIARETASGLAAAHEIGVVHRDIKPGNLWLEAPNGRVKVLDFGLAKPVDTEKEITKSGTVVGTPAYMSLEQGRGLKVDHRTDLFSLGAVMYRLCTGKLPFDGPTAMAVLIALGSDEPIPVRNLNPQVPEPLAALIHQLLEKDPDKRPATADEVVNRIRAISERMTTSVGGQHLTATDSKVEETHVAPLTPRQKPSGKRKWMAAVLALLAVVLAGVIIIIIKNKDGTETKIEVPDDATVTVTKNGETVAEIKPEPGKAKSAPVANPDRRAAEYVLSIGGKVKVNGQDVEIGSADDLPKDGFKLTAISLRKNKSVTDAGLANINGCKNLTELFLDGTNWTVAGIANFKENKDLRMLSFLETPLTDAGLKYFQDCKKLTFLDLTYTKLTESGIGYLNGSKDLYFLSLAHLPITDASLVNFKDCKELTYLDLTSTPVTDVGLANFKDCKHLKSIHIPSTKITNAGLANFKDCVDLERLTLRYNNLNDAALEHLKGCKKLEGLWLEETQVSDEGLAFLKDVKTLKNLNVSNTKVTDKFLDELRLAIPKCQIECERDKK